MPLNTRAYPKSSRRVRHARTSRHVVDRRDELAEAVTGRRRRVAVEVVYRQPVEFVVSCGDERVQFTEADGIPEDGPAYVERVLEHLGLLDIYGLA